MNTDVTTKLQVLNMERILLVSFTSKLVRSASKAENWNSGNGEFHKHLFKPARAKLCQAQIKIELGY